MNQKGDPNLNPLKVSYLVDVNVETNRNDVPTLYRVMRVLDILPDEDDTNDDI